jgi:hypothetical protein
MQRSGRDRTRGRCARANASLGLSLDEQPGQKHSRRLRRWQHRSRGYGPFADLSGGRMVAGMSTGWSTVASACNRTRSGR